MKCFIKQNNGFLLIELIIVITVLSIVATVMGPLLTYTIRASFAQRQSANIDSQARIAITRMTREISEIRSNTATDLSTMSSSQITFNDTAGNSITYSLSGTTLLRSSQTMATHVSSLAFAYLDANGNTTATVTSVRYVMISLTMTQDNQTFSLSTTVYLRNSS